MTPRSIKYSRKHTTLRSKHKPILLSRTLTLSSQYHIYILLLPYLQKLYLFNIRHSQLLDYSDNVSRNSKWNLGIKMLNNFFLIFATGSFDNILRKQRPSAVSTCPKDTYWLVPLFTQDITCARFQHYFGYVKLGGHV